MSHKYGGDVSNEFTNALKNIETIITKTLVENPEALAKIKYLAKLYDNVDSHMEAPTFDAKAYKAQVEKEIAKPKDYVEYVDRSSDNNVARNNSTRYGTVVEYKPLPARTSKTVSAKLPSADEAFKELETKGSVTVTVPDKGGLNPTNSENPVIHPEDVSVLGVPQKAKIKLRYAEATNWSNFKIARDLMQNFYDGNGHTLEGVTIKVDKVGDEYKVRVEGLGKYDYKHLQRTGSSTKPYLVEDLGNFGEGTRVIAGSLIVKGSENVKYGCGEWQLEFGRENGRLAGDDLTQTLTKNTKPVEGNYVEFTTKDPAMVEELLKSKDYFYHPYNENFQNFEYENEFFGFKHLDETEESTIYLGQKYEINDDFKPASSKLCIVFKKLPNYPTLKDMNYNRQFVLSTGCDRVGLNDTDVLGLAVRYAASMTDNELIQAIRSLEDVWTTANPKDDMIISPWGNQSLEYTFVEGLIAEANNRNLQIDKNPKIVIIKSDTPSDQIEYFQENGYRFANQRVNLDGSLCDAQTLYNRMHKIHSLKPTEVEAKKLELIQKATQIFAENDWYSVIPDNIESTAGYVFDSKVSNCPSIHAKIEDGQYKGLFIDRNVLKDRDFMSIVQEALAQMLHTAGNDKSSNYSYELTDLMRTQVNQFINDPTVSKRLRILQKIYNGLGE